MYKNIIFNVHYATPPAATSQKKQILHLRVFANTMWLTNKLTSNVENSKSLYTMFTIPFAPPPPFHLLSEKKYA